MSELFSPFERRMEILAILLNQKMISRLELARHFSASKDAISRDIIALSRYAPICSKMGRYGGIYILDEYNAKKAKALQYIMGHSNITMTLNYYAHATFASAKQEMMRIEAETA